MKIRAAGSLRPGQRAVLEVVLQDAGGQGGAQAVSRVLDGADDFSAADYFGCRQAGNFLREHEIDFQLSAGLQEFVGLEEHAGAADVLGGADMPVSLAEAAVAQRQMELE